MSTFLKLAIVIGLMLLLLGIGGIVITDDVAWLRLFDNLHWTAGTSSAALIAWLGWREGQRQRPGLFWIAVGLSGYAIGQYVWDIQVYIGYTGFPAPSDLFYLTLGPFVIYGMIREVLAPLERLERKMLLLDAAALSMAILTLVLALYLPLAESLDLLSLAVLVFYPVSLLSAACLLLVAMPMLQLRYHWSTPVLIGALVTTGICWMWWNLLALQGETSDGTLLNSLFSFSVVAVAAAVVDWRLARTANARLEALYALILRVLPLLTVVLAAAALIVVDNYSGLPAIVRDAIRLGAVLVILIAFIRQAVLVNEHEMLKAVTRQLEESESQKHLIIDTLPALIWLKDDAGRYLMCNPGFERFFGASEEAIIGKTDYDFVDRELADFFREHDRKAMRAGLPTVNEEWITFATDGHRALLETTKTPLVDSRGNIIGVLGIGHDITDMHLAEQALKESATRLRLLGDNLPDGFTYQYRLHDGQPAFEYLSAGVEAMLGVTPEAVVREPSVLFDLIDTEQLDEYARAERRSREQLTDFAMELRLRHAESGEWHWLSLRSRPRRLDEAMVVWDGIALDITRQKEGEEQLRLSARVFTDAHEAIFICDAQANILTVNPTFSAITGYCEAEVVGRNPRLLKSDRHGPEFYAQMWRALRAEGQWSGEVWNRRKNGELYAERLTISTICDGGGEVRNYIGLFSDITQSKMQQEKLEQMAHFDALTRLPNRVLLADRLNQAMTHSTRRSLSVAVLYLDLDGFKEINDEYGHQVGDQLLVTIAESMRSSLRAGDTIARLGGDEFVAVLNDLEQQGDSLPLIERLLKSVSRSMKVGDHQLQVSASIGVTYFPQNEEVDADQLLRQADQAMYQAKLLGKNRYYLFDTEQDRSVRGLNENLQRIRQALDEREFVLYYQPKVNMHSGEVVGVEALIRWQHPERGLLAPAEFLPLIEEHSLASEVGDWVIDTALSQSEQWQRNGLELAISVNLSARHLQEPDFLERIEAILADHPGYQPGALEFEVLETSALENITHISELIEACREMGIHFSLDDFGTGYSSLNYLKRLPVSTLKIDQGFVRNILDDPDDLAILEGVMGLAEAFRQQTIAEGVETTEHGELLLQLGYTLAQGYGIARPMPAEQVDGWVGNWVPAESWLSSDRLSRDGMDLLYVAVEHRAWVRKLVEYLHGGRSSPPTAGRHNCPFGRWIESQGRSRYGVSEAFQAIERLHVSLHRLAEDLLRQHAAGEPAAALPERIREIYELQEQLVGNIKLLISQSRALDTPSGRQLP